MTEAAIVGWAHTPFGKLEEPDVEGLIARVSGEALAHAGVEEAQVDGIYVGSMNTGFSKQGFEGSLVAVFSRIQADIGDEQSLQQSLSTFSSHISRIVRMLRDAASCSLILLDELLVGREELAPATEHRAVALDAIVVDALA